MGKQSNIQCQSCHGNMGAVGKPDRKGWLDGPNCQACHQEGERFSEAVIDLSTGTLRHAVDLRFATSKNRPETNTSLYRFSTGHGDLQCSACHGSTHAIYPSSHKEDNLQSIAVQGHEGTISECLACHKSMPKTVSGGPHGMHPTGDWWVSEHGNSAKTDLSQCAYCHGNDYRGKVLSKAFSTRTFSTQWGVKTFNVGQQVSCYTCHNGPTGA